MALETKTEEVEKFGFWWRTRDRKIQLSQNTFMGNFTREEAQKIAPQIRNAMWGPKEDWDGFKYELINLDGKEFYIYLEENKRGRSVVLPLLKDGTYGRTDNASQLEKN